MNVKDALRTFQWSAPVLAGLVAAGVTTAATLNSNDPDVRHSKLTPAVIALSAAAAGSIAASGVLMVSQDVGHEMRNLLLAGAASGLIMGSGLTWAAKVEADEPRGLVFATILLSVLTGTGASATVWGLHNERILAAMRALGVDIY
jgi:hypothetical protein